MKKLAIVMGLAHMAQLTDMFLAHFSFKIGFQHKNAFNHFRPALCFVGEKPGILLKCAYSHARVHLDLDLLIFACHKCANISAIFGRFTLETMYMIWVKAFAAFNPFIIVNIRASIWKYM